MVEWYLVKMGTMPWMCDNTMAVLSVYGKGGEEVNAKVFERGVGQHYVGGWRDGGMEGKLCDVCK